jgi:hypothetical protein
MRLLKTQLVSETRERSERPMWVSNGPDLMKKRGNMLKGKLKK